MIISKNNYIMVEQIAEKKDVMHSGIILPDVVMEDEQLAQAVVVITPDESEYKVGDIVLCHKIAPDDLNWEENGVVKKMWALRSSDVMFVVRKD